MTPVRLCLLALLLFILIPMAVSAVEYDHPMFIVGATGDLPLMVTNGLSFSFFAEFRMAFGLGIQLDFNFSQSYFYFKDGSWHGPSNWDEVHNMGTSALDWSFYQWNCHMALLVFWYPPFKWPRVAPYIAAGPTLLFLMPAESADHYPEFNDYFEEKRSELSYIPGLEFRLGSEFRVIGNFLFMGAGLKYKMGDLKGFADTVEVNGFGNYFLNNTEIFITMSLGF